MITRRHSCVSINEEARQAGRTRSSTVAWPEVPADSGVLAVLGEFEWEISMPKRKESGRTFEISEIQKASYWLSHSVVRLGILFADFAAFDDVTRDQVRRTYLRRVGDVAEELSIALEAYGEIIRAGDVLRAQLAIAELESPVDVARRRKSAFPYQDPVEMRSGRRSLHRRLLALKKALAATKRENGKKREVRSLESDIKVLEELLQR